MTRLGLRSMGWRGRAIAGLSILTALVATRWPLAPKHLYSFDAVNFALALREFNPGLHQPQPPGYPFFVGLTRAIHVFLDPPEQVFLVSGLLAGAVALLCLWLLGDEMFGDGIGITAVLLFLFHPVFWFGGLTNQVRVFLAAGGCATALFAWRAWQPGSPSKWFYACALALGLGAGFRPSSLLFLAPLFFALAWRRRGSQRELFASAGILAAAVASWLGVLLYIAGGLTGLWRIVADYSQQQFQGTSLLFGAEPQPAWKMAEAAAVWNGIGILSWIWAAPFVFRTKMADDLRRPLPFLLLWFVPAFVFFAFVHVGDPDHTLVSVPVTCLLGAKVLAGLAQLRRAGRRGGRRLWRWALVMAVAFNILLFVRPRPGLHRATSLRQVRTFDRQISAAFQTISEVKAAGPVLLVACGSFITWRHLEYYFPDAKLFVMEASNPPAIWELDHDRRISVPIENGQVMVPHVREIVVLLPPNRGVTSRRGDGSVTRQSGPLVRLDAQPDLAFQVENLTFRVPSETSARGGLSTGR